MPTAINPQALKAMLTDGQELALLDVREEGEFGEGHMLYATPKPYSIFERGLNDLVPRKPVRTVLVDGGNGVAEAAAHRMEAIGYTDVAVLAGGVEAWRSAGFEIFQGVNVPSKAFGEVVEVTAHTPAIPAKALAAMQATGENIIVLDGRSPEEFARMSIPGGISVPNAELVYRIHDLAPDPATTVIVNCAGRTRSIIGAQALINAGVPNRVVALKGGTMGWRLAGLQLNHGRTDKFPPLSEAGRAKAVTYAADVRRRFNVPMAAPRTVETWLQNTSRTTYLLDVRSVEEFQAGHMPGARHAPGGQLVQGADQWCGVKGGRIILLDDAANVRATLTGHWLGQMGWDVHVLEGGIDAVATETRIPEIETPGLPNPRSVTPEVLASGLAAKQVAVAHVDLSSDYQAGHIPGAVWGIRSRMDALLDNLSGNGDQRPIVLYSEHETRARLAAVDLATLTDRPISILAGGREAWKKEGRPLETTTDRPTDAERIDFLFWVHDRHLGNDQAARDYLAWEEQLPGQIEADGDATFQIVR